MNIRHTQKKDLDYSMVYEEKKFNLSHNNDNISVNINFWHLYVNKPIVNTTKHRKHYMARMLRTNINYYLRITIILICYNSKLKSG